MTLFDVDPETCPHGRLSGERCPWCERSQPPYVRASGESREAAERIEPSAGSLRARVLEVIAEHGPICDERCAQLAAMNPSTQRPRRIELYEAGLIEKAGTTLTQAGRKAVAWRVTTSSDQG